jgi:ribonucleoside-diphosphate reductase alpha chain
MMEDEYFDTSIGLDIFNKKYRHDDETFDEWVTRVSGGDSEVSELIYQKKFMFAGRILAGRGIPDRKLTYSNCYVLPAPEDNLESIYQTASDLARTFSYGGGVGIDLSKLSPEGTPINNAAKFTSGAVSFANLYNTTTDLIGQDGRRGALMLSMSTDHFEIEKFVKAKTVDGALQRANISVRMSDRFMEDVESGKRHFQSFERDGKTFSNTVNSVKLFDQLVKANYDWSEPGVLFWDRIESWNLMSEYDDYALVGTNPCGEQPLVAGGSCLLGSINLSEHVVNGRFDINEFQRTVKTAVKAMNGVLDEGIEKHPLKIQRDAARDWRQIGIGVMGYADMLVKLGIKYGSPKAMDTTIMIADVMVNTATHQSALLAKESGTFPNYDEPSTMSSKFINSLWDITKSTVLDCGLRNAGLLSIAPNGTISTMLNISGGIEPMFALEYNRRTESLHGKDKSYIMRPKVVQEYMNANPDSELPDYFVTAADIAPLDRVKVQAVWQKFIDASISSTVNLPEDATEQDVRDIYMSAWKEGLKGITVHRNGNKREGVLTVGDTPSEKGTELARGEWNSLSDDIVYHKRKIYTGCGKISLFVGYSDTTKRIEEIYMKRSGKGGCERTLDGLVIAMSGMLRLGGDMDNVEKALNGIGACNSFTRARLNGEKLSKGANCAYAILNVLKTFKNEEDVVKVLGKALCPECNEPIVFEGGCSTCKACGFSKCS